MRSDVDPSHAEETRLLEGIMAEHVEALGLWEDAQIVGFEKSGRRGEGGELVEVELTGDVIASQMKSQRLLWCSCESPSSHVLLSSIRFPASSPLSFADVRYRFLQGSGTRSGLFVLASFATSRARSTLIIFLSSSSPLRPLVEKLLDSRTTPSSKSALTFLDLETLCLKSPTSPTLSASS